jgi:predicted nuclease of restriction endonuclease-like (RecB) superfamily
MSRRIVSTFINRNPRNVEFLNLKRIPTGYEFELDREQRNFLYKLVLY